MDGQKPIETGHGLFEKRPSLNTGILPGTAGRVKRFFHNQFFLIPFMVMAYFSLINVTVPPPATARRI